MTDTSRPTVEAIIARLNSGNFDPTVTEEAAEVLGALLNERETALEILTREGIWLNRDHLAIVALSGGAQDAAEPSDRRERACVENWPECVSGGYDPRCCRFPKSCSVRTLSSEQYDAEEGNRMTVQRLAPKGSGERYCCFIDPVTTVRCPNPPRWGLYGLKSDDNTDSCAEHVAQLLDFPLIEVEPIG